MSKILNSFYTDKIKVYRMKETTSESPYGGPTKHTRELLDKTFWGRVRNKSGSGSIKKTDTIAKVGKENTIICGLEADIKEGDLLVVIRGAKVGGRAEEKYLVGAGEEFREPFGGVSPQIYHKRFCILKEEYIHDGSLNTDEADDLDNDLW